MMLASSIARRELLRSTAAAGRVAHRVPARLVHFKPPKDLDFRNLGEARKNVVFCAGATLSIDIV